jgi:hypothetical protein
MPARSSHQRTTQGIAKASVCADHRRAAFSRRNDSFSAIFRTQRFRSGGTILNHAWGKINGS